MGESALATFASEVRSVAPIRTVKFPVPLTLNTNPAGIRIPFIRYM